MTRGTRGFTLIELILVVALVVVLVALVSPMLTRVRYGARESVSLSNLRQHSASVASYCGDFADQFPYFTDPGATFSVVRCVSADVSATCRYFGASSYWWLGMADGYYDGNWRSPSFASPLNPNSRTAPAYALACTMLAAPEYFDPQTRMPPPSQLRSVKASEVVFPALKGELVDGSSFDPGLLNGGREVNPFHAAFVDGHARRHRASDLLPQMQTGDGPYPEYGADFPWVYAATHTLNGVRGRDVE
jgi:prepilin-type N-terminal cleavage/methylation domain-containing protein